MTSKQNPEEKTNRDKQNLSYSHSGIITINAKALISYADETIEQMSGYTLEELKKKPLSYLFTNFNESDFSKITTDEPLTKKLIFEFLKKDGNKEFVEVETSHLRNLQRVSVFIRPIHEDNDNFRALFKKMKKELDKKNRILAVQSMILDAKDELLLEIKKRITAQKLDLLPEFAQMVELIETDFNESKEWSMFKMQFDEIHPRFFRSLRNHSRVLTSEDLRLCAYLRLNLSTKEIASILHIEMESVNKKRNRLRKKLGITGKEHLQDFLDRL
jgi:PAS domain S-box-containing protein